MRKIPLGGKRGIGKFAIVDNEDYEWLVRFKWHLDKSGYAVHAPAQGVNEIRMHRILLVPGNGREVDHIDGNRLDNRKANLRVCTRQQNCFNKKKTWGSSRFKGVSLDKTWDKWTAKIQINKKQIHIGRFKKEIEAARAYDKFALKLFGEYAKINFPEESKRGALV
jgi:HNH endonuclease/AP2 domain